MFTHRRWLHLQASSAPTSVRFRARHVRGRPTRENRARECPSSGFCRAASHIDLGVVGDGEKRSRDPETPCGERTSFPVARNFSSRSGRILLRKAQKFLKVVLKFNLYLLPLSSLYILFPCSFVHAQVFFLSLMMQPSKISFGLLKQKNRNLYYIGVHSSTITPFKNGQIVIAIFNRNRVERSKFTSSMMVLGGARALPTDRFLKHACTQRPSFFPLPRLREI